MPIQHRYPIVVRLQLWNFLVNWMKSNQYLKPDEFTVRFFDTLQKILSGHGIFIEFENLDQSY